MFEHFNFAHIEINDYQKARALMATLFHAALLASGQYPSAPREIVAGQALASADAMLEELGITDPDQS